MGKGPGVLEEIPGISMDEWDRNFYYDYFVKKHGRNPTIVEIMDLNNANSEHSRHGFFRGKQVVDGEEQEKSQPGGAVLEHDHAPSGTRRSSRGIGGGIGGGSSETSASGLSGSGPSSASVMAREGSTAVGSARASSGPRAS